jgi:6-phosphogluconolactonase
MDRFELRLFADADELARVAAEEWLAELAAHEGDYFAAISGGRIARTFFRELARLNGSTIQPFNDSTPQRPLDRVHFFWGDERCVPPSDPESNYRMAWEELLLPAKISAGHIHRIRGEQPPAEAAREAAAEMKSIVPLNSAGWPVLDMIFLGMGEDGHVASLFPSVRTETSREIFFPVVASKPPPNRITLSYEVIAAAKNVCVLASGAGKIDALKESLDPKGKTPFAEVIGRRLLTKILTDITI